jgi:hypothetical protein
MRLRQPRFALQPLRRQVIEVLPSKAEAAERPEEMSPAQYGGRPGLRRSRRL